MVPPTRIERATRGLGNRCSIQLSYGGVKSTITNGMKGCPVPVTLVRRPRHRRHADIDVWVVLGWTGML